MAVDASLSSFILKAPSLFLFLHGSSVRAWRAVFPGGSSSPDSFTQTCQTALISWTGLGGPGTLQASFRDAVSSLITVVDTSICKVWKERWVWRVRVVANEAKRRNCRLLLWGTVIVWPRPTQTHHTTLFDSQLHLFYYWGQTFNNLLTRLQLDFITSATLT